MNQPHSRRGARLVTLPLEKLHVAANNNAEPVQWITIPQRNNIFFVYECALCNNNRGERRIIKVTSGAEVMELMDLDLMVRIALTERSQSSPYSAQPSQQDICALVRSPMIAMRYRTDTNQTRTFQMRFTDDFNYKTALEILEFVQYPIKPAAVTAAQRPATAGLASSVSPASPMWGSQQALHAARRAPTPGGPLRDTLHRPLAAHRTASRRVSLQRPSTAGTLLQHSTPWTYSDSTATPPMTGAEIDRSSQTFLEPRRSQTPYHRNQFAMGDEMNPLHSPIPSSATRRQIWSSCATLGSSPPAETHSYEDTTYANRSFLGPSLSDPYATRPQFYSPLRNSSSIPESSQTISSEITPPQTAVSVQAVPQISPTLARETQQTMSQLMPPRRELPFSKPALSAKPNPPDITTAAITSRPTSATLDLPELPKPTFIPTPRASNVSRQGSPEQGTPAARLPAAKLKSRQKVPLKSSANLAPKDSQKTAPPATNTILAIEGFQNPGNVDKKRKRPASNLQEPRTSASAQPNPNFADTQTPPPPPPSTPTSTVRRRAPKKLTLAKAKVPQQPNITEISRSPAPIPEIVPPPTQPTDTLQPPATTTELELTPTPKQPINEVLQPQDLEHMDGFIRKLVGPPPPPPAPSDEDLQKLAGLSEVDRQAEIETMICGLLHDEDFLKLAEAVENSWVRIGFELRK